MNQNVVSFNKRMKTDRNFRRKMLSAWKSGNLVDTLLMEGYTFLPEQIGEGCPQVRTGIRAGGCSSCSPCGCGSE